MNSLLKEMRNVSYVCNLKQRIALLPKELQIEIAEYNVDHRIALSRVHQEMKEMKEYNDSLDYCDNDMCESSISKWYCIESKIMNDTYYFCDDYCASYGSWSIKYDMRKSRRNVNRTN